MTTQTVVGANIQSQIDVLAGAFVSEHIEVTKKFENINDTTTSKLDNIKAFLSKDVIIDGTTTPICYISNVDTKYANSGSNLNLYGVISEEVTKQALQHVDVEFQKHTDLTDNSDAHYKDDAVISLGGLDEDTNQYATFSINNTDPVRLYNAALKDVGGFIVGDKIITANGIIDYEEGVPDNKTLIYDKCDNELTPYVDRVYRKINSDISVDIIEKVCFQITNKRYIGVNKYTENDIEKAILIDIYTNTDGSINYEYTSPIIREIEIETDAQTIKIKYYLDNYIYDIECNNKISKTMTFDDGSILNYLELKSVFCKSLNSDINGEFTKIQHNVMSE